MKIPIDDEHRKLVKEFGAHYTSSLKDVPEYRGFESGLLFSHRDFEEFFRKLKKGEKVLEIGTCYGYNAVLIAEIVGSEGFVYTTEIVPELINISKKNIEKLKIKNIEVIETDGSQGWKQKAPYDKIIITAACPEIPKPIIEQLKVGGNIVAPVGPMFGQKMVKLTNLKKGFKEEYLGEFVFVPLKGKYGY